MLNPYTLLTREILDAMLRQEMYFVRQTYRRGGGKNGADPAHSLLLTHYGHHDIDRERADRHMRLLSQDPNRFLYDSTLTEHRERLYRAADQPQGYKVYINLLQKEWKAPDALKRKISRFVQQQLSWWNYTPADKLKVTLRERYGELFIALLWKGQQTEVLLEEIENFIYVL